MKKLFKNIEFRVFLWLLKRFCRATDQWDTFQIDVPWTNTDGTNSWKEESTYYIYLGLAPPDPSWKISNFRKIK